MVIFYAYYRNMYSMYTGRAPKRAPVGLWVPCPFQVRQGACPCPWARSLWGTPQGRFEFDTEIYSPQIALEIQI